MKNRILCLAVLLLSLFAFVTSFNEGKGYYYNYRGNSLLKDGKYEEAREKYNLSLSIKDSEEIKNNIIKSYYEEKKYKEVVETPSGEYFLRGNAYAMLGDEATQSNPEEGMKNYRAALEEYKVAMKSSDDINIKKNYELVLKKLEDLKKQQDQQQQNDEKNQQDKQDNQNKENQEQKDNNSQENKQNNENQQNKSDNQQDKQQNGKENKENQSDEDKQNDNQQDKQQDGEQNKENQSDDNKQNDSQQDKQQNGKENKENQSDDNKQNDNQQDKQQDGEQNRENQSDKKEQKDNQSGEQKDEQHSNQQNSSAGEEEQEKGKSNEVPVSAGEVQPVDEKPDGREEEIKVILKRLEGNEKQSFKNNERMINVDTGNSNNRW